jgi:5'-methylthioadenosine phosphorylase
MLAVIGGSGLYQIEGVKVLRELELDTPFGKPSSPILEAEYRGRKLYFLARHGREHAYPPHLVPYRANLWALKELGVRWIVGVNAVGGINKALQPGDFAVVDQFLDFTKSRPQTFYEGKFSPEYSAKGNLKHERLLEAKKVVHVDVSEPFCPVLRRLTVETLEELNLRHTPYATYVATEGPRLETAAEIRAFALLGGDVVGMTLVPEVVLARELQIHYAALSVVTNPAAGIVGRRLTSEEVIRMMKTKEGEIKKVILTLVDKVYGQTDWDCECESTLEGAEI